jgi:hypothetical protein
MACTAFAQAPDPYSRFTERGGQHAIGAQAAEARRDDRQCRLLRRPAHACPGLRGVPSVSAAADFPGSHDDWGAFVRAPVPAQGTDFPAQPKPDAPLALQQLLDAGVITQAEFQQLRARVTT